MQSQSSHCSQQNNYYYLEKFTRIIHIQKGPTKKLAFLLSLNFVYHSLVQYPKTGMPMNNNKAISNMRNIHFWRKDRKQRYSYESKTHPKLDANNSICIQQYRIKIIAGLFFHQSLLHCYCVDFVVFAAQTTFQWDYLIVLLVMRVWRKCTSTEGMVQCRALSEINRFSRNMRKTVYFHILRFLSLSILFLSLSLVIV